jgi:hypothetical protein
MKRRALIVTAVITALANASAAAPPDVRSEAEVERVAPEEKPTVHPVRAFLETAAFIAANTAYYWWNKDFNAPDWELGWNRDSWNKKLFTLEGVRLDANEFQTNAGTHTVAGAIVYLIGRGNGFGPGTSLILATSESILWEYVAEFKEKVSINDLLTNPLGGFALGETFFQVSELFARGADNGINKTIAAVFSPISSLNGNHRPRAASFDGAGLPADVWHRIDFQFGLGNAAFDQQESRTEGTFATAIAVNSVRGYGRSGARFFGVGRLAALDAAMNVGQRGLTGVLLGTRVSLLGYYRGPGSALEPNGVSVLLALLNSFEYTNRSRPGMPLDQIATYGVAGPAGELGLHVGDFHARLRVEAMPELGMITALADPQYVERYGNEGIKSVLAQRGYYFGYGIAYGGGLSLQYGRWAGGVDGRRENFGSVEGVDRYQERVTNDFHITDGRDATRLWLTVRPWQYGQLSFSLEEGKRFGEMLGVSQSVKEKKAMVTAGVAF